jgi:hypothetical protein
VRALQQKVAEEVGVLVRERVALPALLRLPAAEGGLAALASMLGVRMVLAVAAAVVVVVRQVSVQVAAVAGAVAHWQDLEAMEVFLAAVVVPLGIVCVEAEGGMEVLEQVEALVIPLVSAVMVAEMPV